MAIEIIDIPQGTEIWKAERQKYIGSSDCAAILNKSPWKTAQILFLEKTAGFVENTEEKEWLFAKGREAEIIGREFYEKKTGKKFAPNILRNSDFPYAQASTDGMAEDGELLEVKLLGTNDYIELLFNNKVPEKYIPQLNFLMMVGEKEFITFIGVNEKKEVAYFKYPRDNFFIENMDLKCKEFWAKVINNNWNLGE